MAYYVDTSGLAKAIHKEPESDAFNEGLLEHDSQVYCSDLVRVELMRVAGKLGENARLQARSIISAISLIAISPAICDAAGLLEPSNVRSLDAIHLATALVLGDGLEGLLTYDERMSNAARELGIRSFAPGLVSND